MIRMFCCISIYRQTFILAMSLDLHFSHVSNVWILSSRYDLLKLRLSGRFGYKI